MPVSGSPKDIVHEELHRYKHGELHSGPDKYGHKAKNRKQAIAIALNVAGLSNRQHHADGGAPWYVRSEAKSMLHTGPIHSPIPGRTDHVPMSVPNGSYVLPSQHVSHIGENNTMAGFSRLDSMFNSGPFGSKLPSIHHGRGVPGAPGARAVTFPSPKSGGASPGGKAPIFAQGGIVGGDEDRGVPIMAAGGEYVVSPAQVAHLGKEALEAQYGKNAGFNYDHMITAGHDVLDGWVERKKPEHAKTIAKLPGPEK